MQSINIQNIKKVFFYGIGGIGISAIARMMIKEGKHVVGQDTRVSENTTYLVELGAEITVGQEISAVPLDTDLIVYSRAIEVLDPEFLKKIKALQIPSLVYPEMLGLVSRDMFTIAISGCHGKTTTTGMVSHMMQTCGLDPTVVVGSFMQGTHTNFIQGKSQYFVVEADEYHRAFLNLHPNILVITNIDFDHADYYIDIEDVKSAYKELMLRVAPDGYIIYDENNVHTVDCVQYIKQNYLEADRKIAEFIPVSQFTKKRELLLPGAHMQFDASCAAAVGALLAIEEDKVDEALCTFKGTWKRFEYKGKTRGGAIVYDDYAHHPTEVKATLQAFEEKFPHAQYRLHIFFQPHLFSRTKALFNEFVDSFSKSIDTVVFLPIFQAREIDDGSMTSSMLMNALNNKNIKPAHICAFTFKEAKDYLQSKLSIFDEYDVIITLGAGDAYKLGEEILEK